MQRPWFSRVALATVLLAASPAYADDIVAMLENPPDGPVGGIGLVSGWTFTQDEEEDLTIKLRVDGVTQDDVEISCCGKRKDVEEEVSGAPEDTGFGLLVNFANLSPGPHTIGVDIRSSDFIDDLIGNEDRLVIDRSVVVIRPGNTDVINTFNLSNATCSISSADNEIVLNNVQLSSAEGTTTTNLRAAFVPSSQSLVFIESADAPALNSFVAHLNGSQENPRIATSATGEATVTLNADNSLTCMVTTTDLGDATAAHIHLAPAGQNGDIILPLGGGPPTWSCPTTPLTADQVTALREGRLYVNVHTPDHPGGEIRGQLVAAPLS